MADIRLKGRQGWVEAQGTPDGRLVVAGSTRIIKVQRAIAAAGDYAAEDVLSNSATANAGTAWIFDNVGSRGVINKAQVFIQTTALTPRITLYLFSSLPTSELDDNAANAAPALGDWPIFIGQIDFPALEDLGGVSASLASPSTYGNLPLLYNECDNRFYGISVTRDAITGETASDQMGFKLEVDVYA